MFWWLHTNPSKFVSSPWLHFVVGARKPASFYDEFFFFCRSGGSKSSNLLINRRFTILQSAEALLRFSQPRELLSSKAAFTIDLFTDTGAILNLLDLRSIMRCPGGTRSVLTRAFRAKREVHFKFLWKKAIIITSKHGTTIFFSHYNLFLGKLEEKLTRKARVYILSEYIGSRSCPWVSHNP